jgi:hypothetical protein
MKYLKILLIALFAQPCVAQSDFVEVIKDHSYEPLTDADFSYHWDSIPGSNYILLNFKLITLNTSQLRISTYAVSAYGTNNTFMFMEAYASERLGTGDFGTREYDNSSRINVKYLDENGSPSGTIVEFTNLYFSYYPQYKYSYQIHFHVDGRIEFHHGPNNFQADFIGFTQINNEFLFTVDDELKSYFIMHGNIANPTIIDHINTPSPTQDTYDSIDGFNYFPNEDLSYMINFNDLITDIDNITADQENKFSLITKNKQLIITQTSETMANVTIHSLDGSLLLEKNFSDREIQIEVSQYKQQILIVRIENERSVLNKKILVH